MLFSRILFNFQSPYMKFGIFLEPVFSTIFGKHEIVLVLAKKPLRPHSLWLTNMLFSMIFSCRLQFRLRKFMWRLSTYVIYWTIGGTPLALLVVSCLMIFLLVGYDLVELLDVDHIVAPLLHYDMCLLVSLLQTHLDTGRNLHPIPNAYSLERILLLILKAGGMFSWKFLPRLRDGEMSQIPHPNQLMILICVPMPVEAIAMMDGIWLLLRVVVGNTCNLLTTSTHRLLMIDEVFYYVGH